MAVPDDCFVHWLEITALEEDMACPSVSGLKFTGWRRKLLLQVFELAQWTVCWDSCGISLWPVLPSLVLGNLCWESAARQGATAWINTDKSVWTVCQNPALWGIGTPESRFCGSGIGQCWPLSGLEIFHPELRHPEAVQDKAHDRAQGFQSWDTWLWIQPYFKVSFSSLHVHT